MLQTRLKAQALDYLIITIFCEAFTVTAMQDDFCSFKKLKAPALFIDLQQAIRQVYKHFFIFLIYFYEVSFVHGDKGFLAFV